MIGEARFGRLRAAFDEILEGDPAGRDEAIRRWSGSDLAFEAELRGKDFEGWEDEGVSVAEQLGKVDFQPGQLRRRQNVARRGGCPIRGAGVISSSPSISS